MNTPTPKPLNLTFADLALSAQDVDGWLLGSLLIMGVLFNVEAVEVEPEGRTTVAVNPSLQNRIDDVGSFDDGDSYCTVQHEGKRYFVVIFPSQD